MLVVDAFFLEKNIIHVTVLAMRLLQEFFDPFYLDSMLRVFVAMTCGLIIGIERNFRGKPAGVRTNMLICMGACLFMIISQFVADQARADGFTTPDPARIAAQVVTGIGFLGAGAILRNQGIISGLTSAASIWAMAAIGLAAGVGLFKLALSAAFLTVASLELFRLVVQYIRVERFRYVRLDMTAKKEAQIIEARKALRGIGVTYSQEKIQDVLGEVQYRSMIYYRGRRAKEIEETLTKIKGIRNVALLTQDVE